MFNIAKYERFIFEAASTSTEISKTKLKISEAKDELKASEKKMQEAKKTASGNETAELQAESTFFSEQSQIYQKMIPLLNTLKSQIDKKISELKG